MTKYIIALALAWCCVGSLWAQDPQYTQFYANPLYLNPAFAGATGDGRLSANFRYQWPNLDVNYITYSASYDQFVSQIKSGIGFHINQDQIITKNDFNTASRGLPIKTTSFGGTYSYLAQLSDRMALQMGLQASVHSRKLSNSFVFEDDLLGNINPDLALIGSTPNNFLDFSGGALLYSESFWAGVSAYHLNQPNQSLLETVGGIDKLPMKLSFQMGYRFNLVEQKGSRYNSADISFMPVVHYRMQGKSDQLDAGFYLNYEPVTFGVWYRGIPFKIYEGEGLAGSGTPTNFASNDALALLLGFKREAFSFVYSYDITVSSLGQTNTGGSHEISIVYNFTTNYDRARNRPRYKNLGRIYCPNPWKQYQKLKKG